MRGERVGFIGLGIMGRGMAACLLRAGAALSVFVRRAEAAAAARAQGAAVAASPAALAEACEAVVLCVTDDAAVEALLFGPEGLAHAARPPPLVIDCSTIAPAAAATLAARAAEAGILLVDAPVSGGSEGAAKGTLVAMVGGSDAAVARARPVLGAFCRQVTHVGESGAGQKVKMVNQILVAGHALAMSEALLFARDAGVDPALALEAVVGGAGGSWMLTHRAPQILADDYRPGFTVDNQQKDLRLVRAAAAAQGTPLLLTALVEQLYTVLQARGLGGDGNHALYRALSLWAAPR